MEMSVEVTFDTTAQQITVRSATRSQPGLIHLTAAAVPIISEGDSIGRKLTSDQRPIPIRPNSTGSGVNSKDKNKLSQSHLGFRLIQFQLQLVLVRSTNSTLTLQT